jgi:hypothetical protein
VLVAAVVGLAWHSSCHARNTVCEQHSSSNRGCSSAELAAAGGVPELAQLMSDQAQQQQ